MSDGLGSGYEKETCWFTQLRSHIVQINNVELQRMLLSTLLAMLEIIRFHSR